MKLLEYVKMHAKMGGSHPVGKYYDWLAKNGQSFSKINVKASKRGALMGKIKECYRNAFVLADVRHDFKYYEGYFIKDSLPVAIEHAFLVDKDGQVIDPTMGVRPSAAKQQIKKYYKSGEVPKDHLPKPYDFGDEYFGVQIPLKFVREQLLEVKTWSPVAFAYYLKRKQEEVK